jgi:hypothetical protein
MAAQKYGRAKGWFVEERSKQLEALAVLAAHQMDIDEIVSTSPYSAEVGEDYTLASFDSFMHALLEFVVYMQRMLVPSSGGRYSGMSEEDVLEGMAACKDQLMKDLWEKEFMRDFQAWSKDPTLLERWKKL